MQDVRVRSFSVTDIVWAMRPAQWTKNIIVLAAFFFAVWDRSRLHHLGFSGFLVAAAAAVVFCVVSSGIYLINDIRDIGHDRNHPLKKFRPVAAGRIPISGAWCLGALLLALGGLGALLLSPAFAYVIAGYIVLQFLYSFGLKQIALLDILVIAIGFVLRAISGAVVLEVVISPWLLLCAFLLALFLALCKRRHEKNSLADTDNNEQRPSLEQYDERLLDQLIAICGSATIAAYAIYTLWPQTIEKFGTAGLGYTIPFVVFGIFRYLDLVYRHEKGDRPEKILLTDIPLLADIALYGISVIVILTVHSH